MGTLDNLFGYSSYSTGFKQYRVVHSTFLKVSLVLLKMILLCLDSNIKVDCLYQSRSSIVKIGCLVKLFLHYIPMYISEEIILLSNLL